MNKVYKIKRLRDGRFYRGRSKFTKFGSYFRLEQIVHNIGWVINQYPDDQFELIPYSIEEETSISVDTKMTPGNFFEIIERDKKLDQLLNGTD